MNEEITFRLLTGILLVLTYSVSGYFRARANRQGGTLDRSGDRLVVVLRLLGLLVIWPLFAYLINPTWVAWARVSLPDGLRWTAVGIAFLTLPTIVWLFVAIGDNISPSHATRQGHQLITHGPYRYIRHPLYTFGFTLMFALALVSALWWLMAGLLGLFALVVWRTSREEQQLIEMFGDEYRTYMKRTGRYVPRFFYGG